MFFDYYCASIPVVPDTKVGCLAQLFSLVLLVGFFIIVMMNKRYRHITEWLMNKLSNWF